MPPNRRRRSKKESYWREQVARWRDSGLSQAEFSRQAGFSSRLFGYWKRRFEQAQGASSVQAVVAVPMPHAPEPKTGHQPIIVHAWHDVRLEIPDDFHPGSLEKILVVLGRLA